MSRPVLIVDSEGTVVRANEVAKTLLGPVVGRPCFEAVHLRDRRGRDLCDHACAAELCEGTADSRDQRGVANRRMGGRVLCDAIGDQVVVTMLPVEPRLARTQPLSPRERQVLSEVALGHTNKVIAQRLGIRPATVRTHLEHARDKLDARTRAEAVNKARLLGELG